MAFFYFEIKTDKFILASNMKSISEFAGIPYHKVYNWFNNDTDIHKDEEVLCVRTEMVRGKQRLQKGMVITGKISRDDNPAEKTSSAGSGPDSVKEEVKLSRKGTVQPEKRDMSKFDDFFKEVE
jgi:hypothetical protein